MKQYNQFIAKSKGYATIYLITILLCIVIIILMIIPLFKFGFLWQYFTTATIFILCTLALIYFFINYLLRPKTLVEISNEDLKINRRKNKTIIISFDEIDSAKLGIGFLSLLLTQTGNVIIILKNKKEINIGYCKDYTKAVSQINSIKYIKSIGGN